MNKQLKQNHINHRTLIINIRLSIFMMQPYNFNHFMICKFQIYLSCKQMMMKQKKKEELKFNNTIKILINHFKTQ